jgi:threonine/homoserine/homoserine lactone efflux protein
MELILSIALIHLLACLSPGPDIFLVVLNSLRHDWRVGVWTTLGILSGVSLQIALGITGITLLLTRGGATGQIIALAGGAWLIYLGVRGIAGTRRRSRQPDAPLPEPLAAPALADAWLQGLLVNLLNPKALLYFLSIFSVMLGPEVSLHMRIACGLTMISVQGIAFSLVALLIDRPHFKDRWARLQGWLELGISCLLTAIGLWIWISTWLSWMD